MEVVLSQHAAYRCRGRHITIHRLIEQVKTLPPCETYVEWTFPGGITAGVVDKEGKRVVVTVFRKRFKRKRVAR